MQKKLQDIVDDLNLELSKVEDVLDSYAMEYKLESYYNQYPNYIL